MAQALMVESLGYILINFGMLLTRVCKCINNNDAIGGRTTRE